MLADVITADNTSRRLAWVNFVFYYYAFHSHFHRVTRNTPTTFDQRKRRICNRKVQRCASVVAKDTTRSETAVLLASDVTHTSSKEQKVDREGGQAGEEEAERTIRCLQGEHSAVDCRKRQPAVFQQHRSPPPLPPPALSESWRWRISLPWLPY